MCARARFSHHFGKIRSTAILRRPFAKTLQRIAPTQRLKPRRKKKWIMPEYAVTIHYPSQQLYKCPACETCYSIYSSFTRHTKIAHAVSPGTQPSPSQESTRDDPQQDSIPSQPRRRPPQSTENPSKRSRQGATLVQGKQKKDASAASRVMVLPPNAIYPWKP